MSNARQERPVPPPYRQVQSSSVPSRLSSSLPQPGQAAVSAVAILMIDTEGRILAADDRAGLILGIAQDQLTHRSLSEFCVVTSQFCDRFLSFPIHQSCSGHIALVRDAVPPLRLGFSVVANVNENVHLLTLLKSSEPVSPIAIAATSAPSAAAVHPMSDTAQQLHLQSAALDACADVILITDRHGTIEWVNPAFTQLTGYLPSEAIGRNPRDLVNSGQQEAHFFQQLWHTILAGQVWRGELVNRRKDGSHYVEEMTITPVYREGQEISHFIAIKQDITVRKVAEQRQQALTQQVNRYALALEQANLALRQSEQRYRSVLETQTELICRFTPDGVLTFVNGAYCRFFGCPSEALIGRNFVELVPPFQQAQVHEQIAALRQLTAEQPVVVQEHAVVMPTGDLAWHQWINQALFDDQQRVVEIQASGRDITEYRLTAQTLRDREHRLDLFFTQSLDGFFFMMLDEPIAWHDAVNQDALLDYVFTHQRVTRANQAFLQQYGFRETDFLGLTPSDFFAHDIAAGKAVWRQFFDQGRMHIDTNERRADGSLIWVEGDYICLYDDQGRITGHFGVQRDVTDLRQAIGALAESEQQYRLLVENQTDLVVKIDVDGHFLFVSPSYCELFGKTPEELLAKNFVPLIHPDDRAATLEAMAALWQPPHTCQLEQRALTRAGWRWIAWADTAIVDEAGNVTAVVGVGRDITQRKQIEQALQLSEQRFRNVLETLTMVALMLDAQGRILFCNDYLLSLTGWQREEILGRSWSELFLPEEIRSPMQSILEQAVTGQDFPTYYENEILTRTGDRRLIAWNNTVQRDANHETISLTSIGEDITDRKRQETQIYELSQRLSLATEAAQLGVWEWEIASDRLLWDQRMHEIYGTDPETFSSWWADWTNLVHPDDTPWLEQEALALQRGAPGFHSNFRIVRTDGAVRHIESYGYFIRDAAGQAIRVVGVNQDISDRKQSELALSETHQQLQALLQNSPVIMELFDETGRYERINPMTAALLGRSPDDIEGHTFAEIHSPEVAALYMQRVRDIVASNQPMVVEDRLLLQGQERILQSVAFPILHRPNEPTLLGLVATDITDLVTAQENLQRQAERERLLREITDNIRRSLDLDSILNSTVTGIREFLATDRVLIYQFNADGSGDVTVEAVGSDWIAVLGATLRDPCFVEKWIAPYRQGRISQSADIETAAIAPCYRDFLRVYQVRANLALPIVVNDQLWGLLCIHHCQAPRPWKTEEVDFVRQLSDQVEIAIQQAHLLAEAKKTAQQEALRRRITQDIRGSLDLGTILETTVQAVREFLQTDRVLVNRLDAEAEAAIIAQSAEPGWQLLNGSVMPMPCIDESGLTRLAQGQLIQIHDVQSVCHQQCDRYVLKQQEVMALLTLPLIVEGSLWGLMCIQHCRAPRQWQPDELTFVQQITDQVEIAIQQALLLKQTKIQVQREQVLNDIVSDIRHSLDLDEIITRTTQKLLTEFQVSRCVVIRRPANDDAFAYHACATAPGIRDLKGDRVPLQDGLLRSVLDQEAPQATADVTQDPALDRWQPWLQGAEIRALLSVAIRHEGVVKGILCVHHAAPRRWLLPEQRLLKQVADQLAIAMQQAELYQQAQTEIAERQRLEQQLRYDALHDMLTGLPNRALFLERLQLAMQRDQRRHHQPVKIGDRAVMPTAFAVLFLDLDRFKVINDSLGHSFGDQLLQLVAERLKECLREIDIAARLGGDEFVVLLEELPNLQFAIEVARRIHHALEAPIYLDKREVFIHASIGITSGTSYHATPEQILRDADIAMYEAKKHNREYVVFDASMHAITLEQMNLEHDLRHAINRNEFRLCFQPIVALETGRIAGFEALVRWQHPTRGLLYPGAFVEVAEDTGLIAAIDLWVLQQACQQLSQWHQLGQEYADLTMSVNLSGKQFSQPNLIIQIDEALTHANLHGKYLKLEITESVLITNSALAIQTLNQFRARDIQVCMDDFGTGYSSLSYLHQFPVDILKVDKSFILNLNSQQADSRDYEIVKAIIHLALNLNLQVIAEGVENGDVLDYLQQNNCQFGQGYYFSPAIAAAAATQLLLNPPF